MVRKQEERNSMKRYRAATAAVAAALIGSLAGMAGAADENKAGVEGERLWIVDYSGKPPFERRAVTAAEFARFEEAKRVDAPKIGERLRVANYQGRPPFRRQLVEIDANDVAEFARFEETKPASDERRRFGPPGKGFGR
jgi:hypothetical protein